VRRLARTVDRSPTRAPVTDVRRPGVGRASGEVCIRASGLERIPKADRIARKVEPGQQKSDSRNEDERGPENSDPLLPSYELVPSRSPALPANG
jgi:hypothetical protein